MIDSLLKFVDLTHRFQQVRRALYATGEERMENDAEHSFQLALVAWYIVEKDSLTFDTDKVLKYALVHDLVEIHAGDTDAYGPEEHKATKHIREMQAAQQLRLDLPEFAELHGIISAYELLSDEESKFVYALDKMLPPMNVYLDGGRIWQERNQSPEMLRTNGTGKISVSPQVLSYFNELLVKLEAEKQELFPHLANK